MDIAQTTLENDIEFDYIYPSLSLSLWGWGCRFESPRYTLKKILSLSSLSLSLLFSLTDARQRLTPDYRKVVDMARVLLGDDMEFDFDMIISKVQQPQIYPIRP